MTIRRTIASLTWGLLLTGTPAFAQQDPIAQAISEARASLAQQQPGQAYNRLMALEMEAAGDAGFDYWLGVAAVRAGEHEQAITALERVIMVQPGHAGARLELAGVFILERRFLEAEDQLQIVEQMNPPAAAQQAIARYRNVIARAGDQTETNAFSMLGLDAGHDSNYLNYPDSFDLFANTPLEGLAILRQADTRFSQLRGLHYREFAAPLGLERGEWLTVGQSRRHEDTNASLLDSHNLQTSLTLVSAISETSELSASASIGQLWLDGDRYRQVLGSSVGYLRNFDDDSRLTLTMRLRQNNFTDSRNDNTAISADALYSHQLNTRQQLRLQVSAEKENTSGTLVRQGGDSHRQSAELQWRYGSSADQHRFSTGYSYQRLEYKTPGFAVFNLGVAALREDASHSVHVEWTWQPWNRWQFVSRLQHREQTSSLDFFDMDQTVAQLSVNFLF